MALMLVALPAAAQRSAHQRALSLFDRSRHEYDAGRFDEAASLLREAYSLEADPVLLYNMARAYEGAGHIQEAADTYQRYLAEAGDIRDRGAIERRLETLRAQLARQEELERESAREAEAPAPEPTPEVEPPPSPPPALPPPSGGVDPAPWIVAGAGALGVGAGLVLGAFAQDSHASAAIEPVHERAFAEQQQAYDLATGANIAFIAGGAIAVAGLVWAIISLATSGPSRESASRPFEIRF